MLVDRAELYCLGCLERVLERAEAVAVNPEMRGFLEPLPAKGARPPAYRPLPLGPGEERRQLRELRAMVRRGERLRPPG